ncbi:uncharacterized protein LOC127804380 [Diospyros lotus]|uniref:uncharacterized protein LOC127804380 n=1 Tax=Diospyros lotus TaxID=55363 RepID=UPI002250CD99|nr:uncharacterized protein LOC127804380 [Diospyros lotus]
MVLGMINEIQQYLDARYIGPPEAAWRIFGHPLHAKMPTVIRLALHLPGIHRVVFNPEESLETIQSRVGQQMSTLTGFFAYCASSEDECPFTYQEFPQHYSEAQQTDSQISIDCLNNGQRNAYNIITSSVFQNKGVVFFLNGGAGTGKTFLYNTITLKCRNLGHIVITVASSGIASLLLVRGRTAHSTFSIPLDVLGNSNCGLSKQSLQAELFRETKLIIWDEVPMQHRHCVEAVDRTLRDICDSDKPFGGITVVLGGDFRQILPVIPKGIREQIVNASLRHSVLWKHIHILTLDLNMRLNHEDRENANFANFFMEITLL